MHWRQRFLIVLGIVISGAFLWFAFNGLNPQLVWQYIRQANVAWLLIGVVVFFISMVLIAWRWGFLLRGFGKIPLTYLSELVSICYMGNNVYPLRAGEFLRIFLLQRDYRVPVARTTTTIFIERIFDGFTMLAFIVIPLRFIEIESPQLQTAVGLTTPLFALALIVFLLLAFNPRLIRAAAQIGARFAPAAFKAPLLKLSEDVIAGMDSLRQPKYLLGMLVGTLATWLFNAAVYWVVGFAFQIQVSYWVMLVATGAVNLAGVLPASPGQIGVFEFFVSLVLTAVGVPEAQALAYAFGVHAVIWLPPTLLGFVLLIRRGLGLRALTGAHQASARV